MSFADRYFVPTEQHLLARALRSGVFDSFVGGKCERAASHWRTTDANGVQVEIDDFYIAQTKDGEVGVVVEAKQKRGLAIGQVERGASAAQAACEGLNILSVGVTFIDNDVYLFLVQDGAVVKTGRYRVISAARTKAAKAA